MVPARLLYSVRSLDDVIYSQELLGTDDVQFALTRSWPEDWSGHRGRVDGRLLEDVVWRAEQQPLIYVCGPTRFVEAVAAALVGAGHTPDSIRTERFGPTGA
jgi:ferredoxin-NADP reductase